MRFSGFLLLAFFLLTIVLVSALNSKKYEEALMAEQKISMHRSTTGDVMRANSPPEFGKKQHSFYHQLAPPENYDHAVATFRTSRKVYGAQATINVWEPTVFGDDLSSAQMWIKSGNNDSLDVIEVGWHVYPSLYGDNQTRLFISWMSDSYRGSGCYNLFCEGFVARSHGMIIGDSFDLVSYPRGQQRQMTVHILKDPSTGHWWLKVNDGLVGYWPGNIFTHLREAAYQVDWGGEVFRVMIDGRYMPTKMGSGYFSHVGYKKACYIANLKVALSYYHFDLIKPENVSKSATDTRCYDIGDPTDLSGFGTTFFFGGSAVNNGCL